MKDMTVAVSVMILIVSLSDFGYAQQNPEVELFTVEVAQPEDPKFEESVFGEGPLVQVGSDIGDLVVFQKAGINRDLDTVQGKLLSALDFPAEPLVNFPINRSGLQLSDQYFLKVNWDNKYIVGRPVQSIDNPATDFTVLEPNSAIFAYRFYIDDQFLILAQNKEFYGKRVDEIHNAQTTSFQFIGKSGVNTRIIWSDKYVAWVDVREDGRTPFLRVKGIEDIFNAQISAAEIGGNFGPLFGFVGESRVVYGCAPDQIHYSFCYTDLDAPDRQEKVIKVFEPAPDRAPGVYYTVLTNQYLFWVEQYFDGELGFQDLVFAWPVNTLDDPDAIFNVTTHGSGAGNLHADENVAVWNGVDVILENNPLGGIDIKFGSSGIYGARLPWLFVRGDANEDGRIDLTDAIFIFKHVSLQGQSPRCQDAEDVDDNGDIEETDGKILLNYLFLGGPPPESPFPEMGKDPTLDNLACQ